MVNEPSREAPIAFLEGARIILRPVEPADISGSYARWINEQASDRFTEHARFPWSVADLMRYTEAQRSGRNALHLAIVERATGEHIGNIAIQGIDWIARRGEFAILIGDARRQGQGFGREAATLIIDHAFSRLSLNRISLGVRADHAAAVHLYRSLGFRDEGRLREHGIDDGKPYDVLMMGLLRGEWLVGGPR